MSRFFEEHLNLDAIVAFVDGELSATAYQRAAAHLVRCGLCSGEVSEQASARDSLRSAAAPQMPGSLAAMLFSIPVAAPIGTAVRVELDGVNTTGVGRGRRFRLGASAVTEPRGDQRG